MRCVSAKNGIELAVRDNEQNGIAHARLDTITTARAKLTRCMAIKMVDAAFAAINQFTDAKNVLSKVGMWFA